MSGQLGKASKQNEGRFTAGGLFQGRGAGGSPKQKQLHFTTWNLHRGPQILHLLSLILGTAPAWGGCPEHTAALPAPAEPTLLPHSPWNPGTPRGRGAWSWGCSCTSWQEREAEEALLCCTEKSLISWQIVHYCLAVDTRNHSNNRPLAVSSSISSPLLLSTYSTFSFCSKQCPTFSVSFSHQQQFRFLDIFRLLDSTMYLS